MFRDLVEAKVNVRITARERGKKVPRHCREGHNIWVNQGRQYLAEVISPKDNTFGDHYLEPPVRVVRYMGLGIGGDSQSLTPAGALVTDYPGQNLFDDTVLTTTYLERPVKVTGTAGTGSAAGVWLKDVVAPPTFSGSPITKVEFETLFTNSDLHLSGAYPSVPLSEIGLFLSTETASRPSDEVYDYANPPTYVNAATRQKLIAYNTFDTIAKTSSISLEVHWEISF